MKREEGQASEMAAITAAAEAYCRALWKSDVTALRSLFHPRCRLYGTNGGALEEYSTEEWLEIVAARPAADGPAQFTVRSAVCAADDLGVAVLDAGVRGRSFTDTLSFLKLGDDWRVIAKTFHLHESELA